MLEYVLTEEGSEIILRDLCARLIEGQVGIVPTDTVYGIVCISDDDSARNRIYDMKNREHGKPLQYLIGDLRHCKWLHIPITPNLRKLADAFWPGPLTVVVATVDQSFLGVRIPGHPFIREIIKELGKPLVASSANLAGEDPHQSADDGFTNLNGEPDFLVLQDRQNIPSSTVVQIHTDGSFEILRAGVISEEAIREVLA